MLKDNVDIYSKEIFKFHCVGTPLIFQFYIYFDYNKLLTVRESLHNEI